MRPKPCLFEPTDTPLIFECARCGFRTGQTPHKPGQIVRKCSSMGYVAGEEACTIQVLNAYPGWYGMQGLGDFLQYWFMVCGITEETRIVQWLLAKNGEGCGCKTRQAKLNAAVPFDWGLLREKVRAASWSLWRWTPRRARA